MDDLFKNDENGGLSDFTEPSKDDRRPAGYNPESRRKKVENFVVHIEEFDEDPVEPQMKRHEETSNRPQGKGEIYFTNYQRQRRTYDETTSQDLDMFTGGGTERAPQQRSQQKTPSQKKKAQQKKKKFSAEELKKMGEAYSRTFYIAMVCVLVVTVLLSTVGIQCVNDAIALSASEEEVEVTIPDGITTKEAIEIFKEHDLINVKWFCRFFAAFRGYDKEGIVYYSNGKEKLQPYVGGTYYLSSSMGIEGMLNIILDNSAGSEQTVSVTFPEGYTIAQIIRRLEDYEVISDSKKFISAANYDYNYAFLDDKNSGTPLRLEGFLFPDTYDMFIGESTSSIVKRFLDNFNEKWTDKYDARAKELGFTTTEIITIASIIQKEAAGTAQMADISSVIHNRLQKSTNYPTLQCDSTALYVTNHLKDVFGDAKASPYLEEYDTYMCLGLPKGPICNPGLDAIHAALYPSDTDYLYFCHDKNGNVYYAVTDFEHQQNVAKIR